MYKKGIKNKGVLVSFLYPEMKGKNMNKLICKKCGREILPENDNALKKEYPYYCSFCDENKYAFECICVEKRETEHKRDMISAY